MSVYLDIKSLYPHLKVNWSILMCKICIARRLVVDSFPWCNANFVSFPQNSKYIYLEFCGLSPAGRWWRAECKTGKLQDPGYKTHNLTLFSQKLKYVSICGPCMRSQGWWRLFWKCHIRPTWHCYHALQARPNNSRSFATLLLLYRVSKKKVQ